MSNCNCDRPMKIQWDMYIEHLRALAQEMANAAALAKHNKKYVLAREIEARQAGIEDAYEAIGICGEYAREKDAQLKAEEKKQQDAQVLLENQGLGYASMTVRERHR